MARRNEEIEGGGRVIVLGVDPGTEKSGYVVYDSLERKILEKGIVENLDLKHMMAIGYIKTDFMAIETIDCFGMPVGKETFDTLIWIGRFIGAHNMSEEGYALIGRRSEKMHFCNSVKAKDGNIRQALIDRFGGSKEKAIGKKKTPGPLYGVHDHEWPALAVAVMASDNYGRDNGNE